MSLAALSLVLALMPTPADEEAKSRWTFLPEWNPLFDPLLADPRWPHFGAAYQRHRKTPELDHGGAVSFGEFFQIVGYEAESGSRWETGVQAAVFGVFDLGSDSMDLINADYWLGFPWVYRSGPCSAMLRVYHQSSHLGDEFILHRERPERVNLSYEAVDFKVSMDLDGPIPGVLEKGRAYAGVGWLAHVDPERLRRFSAQGGVELRGPTGNWVLEWTPVAALDLQYTQETGGPLDLSARAGLELRAGSKGGRRMMLLIEYYRGKNPNGQFYKNEIESVGLGLHVYF
jgi:hypothetical protein